MRAYVHRDDYRHQGRFGTYLRRIAINVCFDRQRRLQRRPECSLSGNNNDGNISVGPLASPELLPDAAAAEQEQARLVRGALLTLPQLYRQVVILRHYEGLRFREIAEILEIPPGTVNSRMAEALKRLGSILKPVLGPEMPGPTGRQNKVKLK